MNLDFSDLNRRDESVPPPTASFDPLRLCVFTTIALVACIIGPLAVAVFAGVAIMGYSRARRAGLMRSRCRLGDTRLVLVYLWIVGVLALAATPLWVFLAVRATGLMASG